MDFDSGSPVDIFLRAFLNLSNGGYGFTMPSSSLYPTRSGASGFGIAAQFGGRLSARPPRYVPPMRAPQYPMMRPFTGWQMPSPTAYNVARRRF